MWRVPIGRNGSVSAEFSIIILHITVQMAWWVAHGPVVLKAALLALVRQDGLLTINVRPYGIKAHIWILPTLTNLNQSSIMTKLLNTSASEIAVPKTGQPSVPSENRLY